MDIRHEGIRPDIVFPHDKAASSLKTAFHEQQDLLPSLVYVSVMARQGKTRQPDLTVRLA